MKRIMSWEPCSTFSTRHSPQKERARISAKGPSPSGSKMRKSARNLRSGAHGAPGIRLARNFCRDRRPRGMYTYMPSGFRGHEAPAPREIGGRRVCVRPAVVEPFRERCRRAARNWQGRSDGGSEAATEASNFSADRGGRRKPPRKSGPELEWRASDRASSPNLGELLRRARGKDVVQASVRCPWGSDVGRGRSGWEVSRQVR